MPENTTPDLSTIAFFRLEAGATRGSAFELAGKPIADWVPSAWFSTPNRSSVWVRAYLIAGSQLAESGWIRGEGAGFVFVLFRGSLWWIDAGTARTRTDVTAEVTVAERSLSDGTFLVLIAPYMSDGVDGNESATRHKLDSLAGLLSAITSPNIVHERIYDMIAELGTSRVTTHTAALRNPNWFDAPLASADPLEFFVKVSLDLAARPPALRDRVMLSLRWYEAALREDDGADAVIKHWVSLETLTMTSSNVKPLVATIARAYSWTTDEVRRRFQIGQLQGLRSHIVHSGQRVAVHGALLSFMAALYEDALLAVLDEPSERRAASFLDGRPTFDLTASIAAARSGSQARDDTVITRV